MAVAQNKPDEINARMRAAGLECKTVIKRRAGREVLSVLRMMRPAATSPASARSVHVLTPVSQNIVAGSKDKADDEYGGLLDAYV